MGHIAKERYDQKKIDRLLNHLRVYQEKGQPIDFEILVDGFKVVRRTNDLNMFPMYEGFVDADTRTVEFIIYMGSSNANHKHIFHFGDVIYPDPEPIPTLEGLDIEERIEERIEEGIQRKLKDMKYATLEKENRELKGDIVDLEKTIATLEREKAELMAKQSPLNGVLGEIGSSLVESFIRRNPKVLASIPGGQALAGLIETDPERAGEPTPDSAVSFQPKSNDTSSLSEEDQAALTFVGQLKEQFTKDEFDKILMILQTLAEDKTKIELILNHVNIKHA